MRARGADVTDIVILVCAADDGIMPQTREALNHAKAAEVPIIIAVNKCDSANANPMRVRQEFQGLGMAPEEWGGETIFVDVSALKGDGVDTLLSMILLQAEIMELKANPNRLAVGNVVESSVEQGGPAATVLVRKGTLRVGDVVVCGTQWGKVRALISHDGTRIKSAGPSMAVKVLGLNGAPDAGTEFNVVVKEREAKDLVEERLLQNKESNELARRKNTLESFFQQISSKDDKVLNLIVKTDTQGSNEAIVDSLTKIESNKAAVKVIHSAVGSITESDILLASTSDAIILGFHTKMDSGAAPLAKREGVQIKQYTIIYELLDEVKDALTGLLEPELKEVTTGTAEVRQVFAMSKGGTVAGCYVRDGKLTKGKVRVLRNSEMIHQGVINTLRRFQDEVNEVRNGMECGLRISDFNDYKEGDILESFMIEKVASKL
ncbi:MAG: translation initiation factor IF-2 [Verrucomicrobia bacterium]|nr:translation initiation factor IF-2 [Verrucomicrobiota bacterium]